MLASTHWLLLLLPTLALASCASTRPPRDVTAHTWQPRAFEFGMYAAFTGSHLVKYVDGYLVIERYEWKELGGGASGDKLKERIFVVPSEVKWREFVQYMENQKVWEWRGLYEDKEI